MIPPLAVLESSQGLPVPLFDRLDEAQPLRTLSGEALRQSLAREAARLLNTRCAWSLEELAQRERTVLEYGLPDLSNYHPANPEDRQQLLAVIRETLTAYEPRLANIRVEFIALDRHRQTLTVAIQGAVRVGGVMEPVVFPVVIGGFHKTETAGEADDVAAG